jgi:hypothetical protein
LAPPELLGNNQLQTLEALKDVYTHFNDSVTLETKLSTNLADYIFVPLSYLLKQPHLPDSQINYLLKILALIIRHSWSDPMNFPYVLAKQLFPLITYLTGGSPNVDDNKEIDSKSDELKTSGAKGLNELFRALIVQKESKVYDFFSNVDSLPALGHCVTVLLQLSLNGKTIELQLESLKTLHTLYFELIDDGEILSYILPGTVSSLAKLIAAPGAKTHYTVLLKALEILGDLLVLVYDDVDLKTDFKEIETVDEITAIDFEFDQIQLKESTFGKVHRTKSWLKGTSSQVKLALVNLKKINSHDKFEVRLKLFDVCQGIVKHCIYSLNSSIPIVVQIMAFLSNDERLKIDQKTVFETDNAKHKEIISKVLSNELNTYVDSFTSVIQSSGEQKIISTINAIKFTISQTSNNEFLIDKLVRSSITELSDLVTKSNSKKKKVVDSPSTTSDLMLITKDITRISAETESLSIYDDVISREIQQELADLFQTLGELINPETVIDEILSDSNKTLEERGVSLWISNCLALGYTNKVKPAIIANEFLEYDEDSSKDELDLKRPDFIYSLLEFGKDILDELSDTTSVSRAAEQASSVALDSIGTVANLLRQDFEYELVDYLYPVIDSLASSSSTIRNHALNTSLIIADNLYSGSLYELVYQNVDYLVDSISFKLSNAVTQRTTAILAVCVRIAGYQIIASFKDVMEIVFSLLDHYHGYDDICIGFFLLFEIIADEIKAKYLNLLELKWVEEPETSYKPWGMKNIEQVVNLLDKDNRDIILESPEHEPKFKDEVEAEIGNSADSDDEEDDEALEREQMEKLAEEEAKWTSPVPQEAYMLLQQIVYYGERLLTHPSAKLQTQILRTYNKTLPVFATSHKHMLPIIASIWPIVSKFVNGSDPKVVILAAEVMEKILRHSGSFAAQRFVDFWKGLSKNELLVSSAGQAVKSQKVVLPGIQSKSYEALVSMLVQSLNSLGRFIPDATSEEIIRSCIGVVDVEKFEAHSDIAWIIKFETYGYSELHQIIHLDVPGRLIAFPAAQASF